VFAASEDPALLLLLVLLLFCAVRYSEWPTHMNCNSMAVAQEASHETEMPAKEADNPASTHLSKANSI
jgi:hypothetical protein